MSGLNIFGFTVEGGRGIVEAQTCHNYGMIDAYSQGNEKLSIYNVFDKFGIKMSLFMRLPKDLGFKWNITDILEMVKNHMQWHMRMMVVWFLTF